MNYISNTPEEQDKMLETIGVEDIKDLFSIIPDQILEKDFLDIDEGVSELELKNIFEKMGNKNVSLKDIISFQGGGAYDHYIPSIIEHIILRSEFYTAYTPYQAELSQGTLQSIYEYQSMICELTSMDVANASLLDGGSATGEAITMAQRITGKNEVILSNGIHPEYRKIARTYGNPKGIKFKNIELDENYLTSIFDINDLINEDTGALVLQYPNFYGSIEKLEKVKEMLEKYPQNILLIVITCYKLQ